MPDCMPRGPRCQRMHHRRTAEISEPGSPARSPYSMSARGAVRRAGATRRGGGRSTGAATGQHAPRSALCAAAPRTRGCAAQPRARIRFAPPAMTRGRTRGAARSQSGVTLACPLKRHACMRTFSLWMTHKSPRNGNGKRARTATACALPRRGYPGAAHGGGGARRRRSRRHQQPPPAAAGRRDAAPAERRRGWRGRGLQVRAPLRALRA